jgi:hypothetical protein
VGNEADDARREPRFNVPFQSGAKLSEPVSGEPPTLFPGAASYEKHPKCGSPGK